MTTKTYGIDEKTRAELALKLYAAEKDNEPIPLLTENYPDMTVDDAYEIQKLLLNKRINDDGAIIVGRKIGITSRGMMQQLNCDSPDYGALLNDILIMEGQSCRRSELNLARVEGEIAFIMGEDLKGPGITTADILNATSWVVPCFEVVDVRFPAWKVTIKDTISDNAAAARFMIGSSPKRVSDVNLRLIGMVMEKNGQLCGSAAGAEVMGNPANAAAWLANTLAQYGDGLNKGDIILSGAFMASVDADAGDVFTLSVDGFPALTLRFE